MPQNPIHIIGAGIGGLALGRTLLHYGVSAVLYERMPSTPRHGYGVTLHASSYQPLLDILGMDEWTFRRRVAVDGPNGGSGRIEPNGTVLGNLLKPTSFRAHRAKLENLLREGLDVRWEHSLDRVEQSSSGMKLHFGTTVVENVSVIVGVDGPHSVTRKSLSPDTPLNVLPYVAFNGKRKVKRDLFNTLYARAFADTNVTELKLKDAVFTISVDEYLPDFVSISWVYSRPAKDSGDALFRPNRPVAGATDIPDEFYEEIRSYDDLAQPFKEVFDAEKLEMERVLSWLMRTILMSNHQLKNLGDKCVFFMGDSVHAQPILGGSGANDAIRDGLSLAECISKQGSQGIQAWYNERYAEWELGIKESEENIRKMHSVGLVATL